MPPHAPKETRPYVRTRDKRALRIVALVLGGIVASLGCNPLNLTYFLMPPQKNPPAFDLTAEKKNPKIAIVVSHGTSNNFTTELWNADKELADRVTDMLKKQFKENRQKVEIIPVFKITDYRASHPDWDLEGPVILGKHFEADYVITMEINRLTLYEKGYQPPHYRGNAEINVSVTDVHGEPRQGPVFKKNFLATYPRTHPIPADERSVGAFRSLFIDSMANDLCPYFAAYTTDRKFSNLSP
jgi:hypothetical protein